ncbi:DUF4145 domain-containing protein [Patescibacteria group bacterium]
MKSKKNVSVKILCKKCNIVTNHKLEWEKLSEWGDEDMDIYGTDKHQILICKGCDEVTYRIILSNSEDCYYTDDCAMGVGYVKNYKYYPDRGFNIIKYVGEIWRVPQKIKDVYIETIDAYNNKQLILCSIGVRCIIEAICLDKGIKKGDLNSKIDKLKNKGIITPVLCDGLHQMRLMGNDGAHKINVSDAYDLGIAVELVNSLINECYFFSVKINSLKNRKSK